MIVHWMVNGQPKCGQMGTGVEVTHSFDTNQLHVNCGLCCAYLVRETMGEELRGRLRSEWGETVREMLKARDEG